MGQLSSDLHLTSLSEVEKELKSIHKGGWWNPGKECVSKHRIAIIIPFRNRENHLPILLKHLIPILQRRLYDFRIFVIEQGDKDAYNKGKLINVGFQEALKISDYDCFVFHDVDLIPEDDRILYGCEDSPMHLSVAIDKFEYRLYDFPAFGGM